MRTPGSWLALALVLAMAGAGPVAAQSPAEPPDEEAAAVLREYRDAGGVIYNPGKSGANRHKARSEF